MGKWLLEDLSATQVAWLRYSSALVAYLAIVFGSLLWRGIGKTRSVYFLLPSNQRDWLWLALIGGLTFCASPLLQMTGLAQSLASENSMIIALEPLMTSVLAWIILGEAISLLQMFTLSLAMGGFFIFADFNFSHLGEEMSQHSWGNFLILTSLIGEAFYSILGKKLSASYSPVGIFGTSLALGVGCLTWMAAPSLDLVHLLGLLFAFKWKSTLAWIWMGPLATAAGYLFFMMALKEVSVVSAVFFLFLQPILGSGLNYVILGERLSGRQEWGGVLILVAVVGTFLGPSKSLNRVFRKMSKRDA